MESCVFFTKYLCFVVWSPPIETSKFVLPLSLLQSGRSEKRKTPTLSGRWKICQTARKNCGGKTDIIWRENLQYHIENKYLPRPWTSRGPGSATLAGLPPSIA